MTVVNIRLTVDAENVDVKTRSVANDLPKHRDDDREPTQNWFQLENAEAWVSHMNA